MELYGLLHQRFILTPKGLALMKEKYLNGNYGTCPRVLCSQQNLMPIGMSESPKQVRVKMYCPRCQDIFIPKKKCGDVDGAYFGCSFPHILLQTYPELQVKEMAIKYTPKIYGFKIENFRDQIAD
jgi:casein kinase II subunit beta